MQAGIYARNERGCVFVCLYYFSFDKQLGRK